MSHRTMWAAIVAISLAAGSHVAARYALDSVAQTPIVASGLGHRASMVGACLFAAERTELVTG